MAFSYVESKVAVGVVEEDVGVLLRMEHVDDAISLHDSIEFELVWKGRIGG